MESEGGEIKLKQASKRDRTLQLNKYETAPNFIQFSQNLTCDCLFISVFFPESTSTDHKIVLNDRTEQFYDQLR